MNFMNEFEVIEAASYFAHDGTTPNLAKGAEVLYSLMEWTNSNSDGWPYWKKPTQAASKLITAIQAAQRARFDGPVQDISEADLNTYLRPIKAFLTRQGVQHREVLS